ncbi:MAG: hypothetical protein D8M61_02880 [Ignavibacteriae bacterium]|nr:hypothetical protein [Ignavibacteriota bacterium]
MNSLLEISLQAKPLICFNWFLSFFYWLLTTGFWLLVFVSLLKIFAFFASLRLCVKKLFTNIRKTGSSQFYRQCLILDT